MLNSPISTSEGQREGFLLVTLAQLIRGNIVDCSVIIRTTCFCGVGLAGEIAVGVAESFGVCNDDDTSAVVTYTKMAMLEGMKSDAIFGFKQLTITQTKGGISVCCGRAVFRALRYVLVRVRITNVFCGGDIGVFKATEIFDIISIAQLSCRSRDRYTAGWRGLIWNI